MMKLSRTAAKLLICALLGLVLSGASAWAGNKLPEEKLPTDTKITIGKLANGLTYYIRKNKKPENRAELRLVVNAGSILEDEDQRGLAHFVEHMAFNGTRHFAKHQIIDYLESIGMRFGPDINAYTSFDETVYMLQVPTDSLEAVETGFQILRDWAHEVSFEDTEIDKERGVVIEEWRIGRGAGARMRDKQLPVILHGSRYAERLPIGKKEILEKAPYDAVRRFYRAWYRPELMAVVAVGDFDKSWVEKQITEKFASLSSGENSRERKMYPAPDHKETLYTIASDPEATTTNISVYHKMDVGEEGTERAYRQSLVENLYNAMLNDRLQELMQQSDPPYLAGYSGKGRFIRTKEFYFLGATVREEGVLTGLESLLTEAQRVKRFGFTATELERQKTEMLRGMEQAYNERDKTRSRLYADEYIRNFLTGEGLPGIEYEFELYKRFLPEITLDEVNQFSEISLKEESRVVALSAPKKKDVTLPDEKKLAEVFRKSETKTLRAYEDKVPDLPLVEHAPNPGKVVKERRIPELNVTEWKLSNGVRVVLKPTDFKNDQILFTSFSPGGHSLVSNVNFMSARWAAAIIGEGGLGSFDQIALQKKLAGKIVSVSPFVRELEEGISGSASPQDIETALELIYLYFTAPRKDTTAFQSFRKRVLGFVRNRHLRPEAAYHDTITVTMSGHHYRTRPLTTDVIDEIDLDRAFRIYQDRVADASDFTFFFVGNFEVDHLKPLLEKYIGGLPDLERKESWKDVGIETPKGVVMKQVKKGLEPKSQVSLIFTGPFKWNQENRYHLHSMAHVLQIKLRELLREDMGGTYGVRVSASSSRLPRSEYSVNIGFGCAPDRVEELTAAVLQQIDSLKTVGTTETYLTKVKETQLRQRETNLKENRFWLDALRSSYYHHTDPKNILNYNKVVEGLRLDDIKKAARDYLNEKNYVQVVLLPEQS